MNRFDLPALGIGLGLRPPHYRHILEQRPNVAWFEVLSENYMQTSGRPLAILDEIASRYPVALHGVSMSIGSTDPLDWDYLRELRALCERTRARWISDHLCWTGVAGRNTHDLLPLPFTEEALEHTAARVRAVQDFLGAPLVLENPSTYVEYVDSTMPEWEFTARLLEEADCALLLDVNNLYVNAFNHAADPRRYAETYLRNVPLDRVVQVHVAGHTGNGTHLTDTHDRPVSDAVWDLLREVVRRGAGGSILLEWDANIPPFERAHEEALRALDLFVGDEHGPALEVSP